MGAYASAMAQWRRAPDDFWLEAARAVDWDVGPDRAFDDGRSSVGSWFASGRINGCWNAVDRHVAAGHGERIAIIHDSPVTGRTAKITYRELQDRVAALAGALKARGVVAGDRVVIYMPMVPEALEAMLACARLGAVHSVVFGGFAAHELAIRIDDARPRAIIAGSCGIEPSRVVPYKPMLDAALDEAAHAPDFCVILQRPELQAELMDGRDLDYREICAAAEPAECVPVAGDHPAYILYTSGTTGAPKGVVRPTGGHLVSLAWTMEHVYGAAPGEVYWAASDVGWVVGHSYICYGPLIRGCTTVLFEGKPVGTPDAGTYWRVIAEHGVSIFFTAPTALRAIKREDPEGKLASGYDLSSLRTLFLAGERADPDTVEWAARMLGVPVIDHWWQTETGAAIAANSVGLEQLPIKIGSPSVPMPGYDIAILGDDGSPLPPGTLGAVAIRLPLPPGCLPTLWQAEDRFRSAYLSRFPGYYDSGDSGVMDEDGYLWIMSRTDDVINVAGHRLSTGAMEEVLADHPDVAECAVIGIDDAVKGQVPLGFLCLNHGTARPSEDICREAADMVRNRIGPVAGLSAALVVNRLPKTRSGKILRKTLQELANGGPVRVPPTVDDPEILEDIGKILRTAQSRIEGTDIC
ncbi:AMP-binding protein [Tropicimonas sp. IMCC34011]|uniref:AMP-binding protein n=1 Tax=Tropicimonas sp. IMCC34011 TaxID=2248759 RepID=UPI000E2413E4|nr:AMP-binding protein [Tropicimonas sp. IMCC34011]